MVIFAFGRLENFSINSIICFVSITSFAMLVKWIFIALCVVQPISLKPIPDPCQHLEGDENGRKLIEVTEGDETRYCCGCQRNFRLKNICKPDQLNSTECEQCEAGTYIPDKLHDKTSCYAANLVEPPGANKCKNMTDISTQKSGDSAIFSLSNAVSFIVGAITSVVLIFLMIYWGKSDAVKWRDILFANSFKKEQDPEKPDGLEHEETAGIASKMSEAEGLEMNRLLSSKNEESSETPQATAGVTHSGPPQYVKALPSNFQSASNTGLSLSQRSTEDSEQMKKLKEVITELPHKHKDVLLLPKDISKLARMSGIGETDNKQLLDKNTGDVVQYFVDVVTCCHNSSGKNFTVKEFINTMKKLEMNLIAQTIEADLIAPSV